MRSTRASPASLGGAESWSSGDWRLLALTPGQESSAGQRVGRPGACPLRKSESPPGTGIPTQDCLPDSWKCFPPGWLSLCQDSVLETVLEGPALSLTQSGHTGGPMDSGSLWFTAKFCHFQSYMVIYELLSLTESQLSHL